jgi:predicted CXXCH cytochrome family protein
MSNLKLSTLLFLAFFNALGNGRLGAQENEICFECHNDPELTGSAGDTLYVDSEKWTASIHNRIELECVSCHMDLAGFEDWPHPERLEKVDCSVCHDTAFELWEQGIHGLSAQAKGDLDAASCADCHGSHYIIAVKETSSRVYPSNLPHTCLNCHGDPGLADKHEGMGRAGVAQMYLESVHGKALEKSGLVITATCSSCHGSHKISSLEEFYAQIPKICGNCHAGIYEDYIQGVHGEAFVQGNKDVPICTDCHGEHNIRGSGDPESKINPRAVAETCSHCHEDMTLSRKYGLPIGRLESYRNTYHGTALNLGDISVAHCGSCHGYHNVRASSDPKSSIHPANLTQTCGKCHPNAGENFAAGKIHIQDSPEENIGAWLIKRAYLIFISGLIGGFIAYICVDLAAHHRRNRSLGKKGESRGEETE